MLWLLIIPLLPYFILLISAFSGLHRRKSIINKTVTDIKVSVIVACKNEEANLKNILPDLGKQQYPSDLYEVIIVNDNSEDNTYSVASSFKNIARLKVLDNTGNGKKSALRTGIMSAEGELIMTTDADCRLPERWILSFASFYQENRPDLIIGAVHLQAKQGFFNRFQELEFMSLQGVTAGTAGLGDPVMCNGANLAFTREKYIDHTGKLRDEIASGDDIFLLESIKSENGKILWLGDKEAVAETSTSPTLRLFLNQRARWISKSGSYKDFSTMFIALSTFAANAILGILLVCSIFFPSLLYLYLASFFIKSLPDLLITLEITRRYQKTKLLRWFIPLQVIYPFYVMIVSVYSLFRKRKW